MLTVYFLTRMISLPEFDQADGKSGYSNRAFLHLLGLDLNGGVSKEERRVVANKIRAKWRRVGEVLGPDPKFEDDELDGFGEKENNRDRAQAMLDAWAQKHYKRATRRMLILALKKEGYGALISVVFECDPDSVQ